MKRADGRDWLAGSLVVALLALCGARAQAQLTSAADSTAGATCSGGGGGDGDCRNSAAFTVSCGASCSTFTSRYAWNINADTTVASTHDTSGNAQHNVTFNATAVGGYRLDISTSRVGALGRSADASNCDGSADTSGVTGSSNVALSSGTLSLADPGVIGNGGGDTNTPFNQSSGTAQIFRFSGGVAQSHSLSFTWNGSVRSNSCEASIRQGESSGTTTGCDVCGYPGNPSHTQSSDGHFVTVTLHRCGDGVVDTSLSETCDEGAANGSSSSCCDAACQLVLAGTVCRPSAGGCDPQEVCTGVSGSCPSDTRSPLGTVCRAPAGPCDQPEICDGLSAGCPNDVFLGSTSGSFVCRPAVG